MRKIVAAALLLSVAVAGAETSNTLRLQSLKESAQKHVEVIQQAQKVMSDSQQELLRLEGAIMAFQTVVDEESTTATKISDRQTSK